ncbi:MAG: C69 family dipeptidase [Terricaulis sp.]
MCDSFVVLPERTARGAMLFAKNSDRERNEAQALEFHAAATHTTGAPLQCTYIAIPQVAHTHAVILSRPCWMWGAEMGANEHGVVIGNEAMHAVTGPPQAEALTGMDLLRLALERAGTAKAAVDVISQLLERHGQGGNCGHLNPFFYHNGFLIADGREAYVLETVGRSWACERVRDQRALSNAYSIGANYDAVSADLGNTRFDFAARFTDLDRDAQSFGRGRCDRGTSLLLANDKHDALSMMRILRDHGPEGDDPNWTPERTLRRSICMHAAEGARRSQTTASMVAEWLPTGLQLWFTASSAPCLSIFKPVRFGEPFPTDSAPLTDRFDPNTRWWRHEQIHRAILRNYTAAIGEIAYERDVLEHLITIAPVDIANSWHDADRIEARWRERTTNLRPASQDAAFQASWTDHNRIAGMPDVASSTG